MLKSSLGIPNAVMVFIFKGPFFMRCFSSSENNPVFLMQLKKSGTKPSNKLKMFFSSSCIPVIDAHRFCPGMSASAANSYNMQGLAPSSPIDMFSSVSLITETGVGVWGGGLHAVFYFFNFFLETAYQNWMNT